MYTFFIFFLMINKTNTFLFRNTKWNNFYAKTQEIIQPVIKKQYNNKELYLKETYYIKKHLYDFDCPINTDNINDIDVLMKKGLLIISSKSGSICGVLFKFNIPKVDLILGCSLRNKYNDLLKSHKPLDSSYQIVQYSKKNNTATNFVLDNWLLNQQNNYDDFKKLYFNNLIKEKDFINDAENLVILINNFYDEIEENPHLGRT